MAITNDQVRVPCDVPASHRDAYKRNYLTATRASGRLMLFAGDQKIEHLNDDFFDVNGQGAIDPADNCPEHLFQIASQAVIGAFATQLGLINQYGDDYPQVPYVVKLNSKSHLVSTDQREPISRGLWSVEQVVRVKQSRNLNIVGVGYTCYLGSEYEAEMLSEAAQVVNAAHAEGLLAIIWMYPRGKAVGDEKDPHLIAGACGAAVCLGADFVKVNYPIGSANPPAAFKEAVQAAGRCGVICAGGKAVAAREFLQLIHDQIHIAGAVGNATGRNIHQKDLASAVRLCNAIAAITLAGESVDNAERIYRGERPFQFAVGTGED